MQNFAPDEDSVAPDEAIGVASARGDEEGEIIVDP